MRMTIKLYGPQGLKVAHRDLKPDNIDCDALELAADEAAKALESKRPAATATKTATRLGAGARRESDEG
jgi:hypothetical protein